MKTLLQPFFLICCALWILNQLLELNNVYVQLLFSYLDDLLCLPLTLSLILAVQRLYFHHSRLTLPVWQIVFAVAAFAICFELVLPALSKKYTADVLDVMTYGIGAVGFYLFMNKPLVLKYR